MKMMKKALIFLFCAVMLVGVLSISSFAAEESGNVTIAVNATEVKVGDTFTVVVSNKNMTVASFTCGISFDTTMLKCVSIVGPYASYGPDYERYFFLTQANVPSFMNPMVMVNTVSTVEEANQEGTVGFAYAGTVDTAYAAQDLFTVTFEVLKSGTIEIASYEDTSGTDEFKGEEVESEEIIVPAAHTCGGAELTKQDEVPASCTNNGVKVHYLCSCGKYYEDEACAKEIADIDAWKAGDGMIPAGHTYGDLIPAAEAVHTATELKAPVAAHYFCQKCSTYFTEEKNATSLEELTGETPVHTGTKYTSIGGGKHSISCACGAVVTASKNCSGGEATCTNAAVCEHCNTAYGTPNGHSFLLGYKGKELTVGTCSAYATYAGKCDHCDYEDEKEVVIGAKAPSNHISNAVTYKNITDASHDEHYACCGALKQAGVAHDFNNENHTCACEEKFTGWIGDAYYNEAEMLKGWQNVGGAWYYFGEADGNRSEGANRVTYPGTIAGITYAPNQEALDYCANNGTIFVDADKAWFLFDENGKFLSSFTGVKDGHYYENGMMTWHPGAVEGMYFIGDMENGGNIPANGDTYIIYANDSELIEGACYNFVNGVLSGAEGIQDGKYYEGSRLMMGKGLTKLGEKYIYVRSNGYVVVNAEYYIGANNMGIATGMYRFDENGFMVEPQSSEVNGIVDGKYYENGKVVYGAGLVEYKDGYIYVRSNGEIVVGAAYWITNTNELLEQGCYVLEKAGMLIVK